MTSSVQLEREAEQTRSQLANTLDELRACMTPEQVVYQIADYARDGVGAAFVSNLRHQAINNPMPIVLIAAGMAWLMFGSRMQSNGHVAEHASNCVGDAATDAFNKARDVAAATGEIVSETAANISNAASDLKEGAKARTESVKQSASMAYDTIAENTRRTVAAMADSSNSLGRRTLATSGPLLNFCQQQPLVLMGIGAALGAAIWALLPKKNTEDRSMGGTEDCLMGESDALRDRAQDDAASGQYTNIKEAGGARAFDSKPNETCKGPDRLAEGQPAQAAAEQATLVPSHTAEEDMRAHEAAARMQG
jgi:Protein of unknown function (DUF3618)